MSRRKKTTEEFVQEVFDLVGVEYKVLGKYTGAFKKIKIKHFDCGYEWEVTPSNFSQGRRCPQCSRKKTTEIFKKEVFDLVGEEYEVLGRYTGALKKIKMRHVECGYEYEVQPNSFLQGARCPRCFGAKLKTTEIFKKEIFDIVGSEYKILGNYVNNSTKIKIKHVECGFEWEVKPSNFSSSGRRCPQCNSKGFSKGEKELALFVKSIYDGQIIENDRAIIPSMTTELFYELDIYLPDLKLAVEYNGKYWHERRELELPGYHAYKQRTCDEKGIELINICDDDWNDQEKQKEIKKEIIKLIKQ